VSDRERFRIEIPADVAESQDVPDDLQSLILDPYAVPEPARRARAGHVYLVAAALVALTVVAGLPVGLLGMVAALVLVAGYHYITSWPLNIREGEALEVANQTTSFAVGHASAAMNFEGWRAKPVWNVLVFSADDPPTERGLVRVDALTGGVVDTYVEAIPDPAAEMAALQDGDGD
jgi:hypothetical protein